MIMHALSHWPRHASHFFGELLRILFRELCQESQNLASSPFFFQLSMSKGCMLKAMGCPSHIDVQKVGHCIAILLMLCFVSAK